MSGIVITVIFVVALVLAIIAALGDFPAPYNRMFGVCVCICLVCLGFGAHL